MAKNRLPSFIVFFFLMTNVVFGQSNGALVVVEDLSPQWMVFSEEYQTYVPYFEGVGTFESRTMYVDLNQYQDFHLAINLPEKTSLFFNDAIIRYAKGQLNMQLKVDSLLVRGIQSKVKITVFDRKGIFDGLAVRIIDLNPSRGINTAAYTSLQTRRPEPKNPDFFILSSVFLLAATGALRRFNKNSFEDIFSMAKAFSFKIRTDSVTVSNIFSTTNIAFHLFYAAIMGASIINILAWLPEFYPWDFPTGTMGLVGISGLLSIFLMLLMYAKYPLIKVVGSLFNFNKFVTIHYFDYFRITLIVTILVFGISVVNNSMGGVFINTYGKFMVYPFLLLLLIRPLVIFVKSIKFFNHRKLHLFSYLCTTEIIPLIILLKVFLK